MIEPLVAKEPEITPEPFALNKESKDWNWPVGTPEPVQILVSVWAATWAATWPIINSVKDAGKLSNTEIPISIASQSERKSFLHNCKLTWNSSGTKIVSVKVTVEVAVKSQDASKIALSLLYFLITSLYLMFGLIVMYSLSRVGADNKAAAMYLPENCPA